MNESGAPSVWLLVDDRPGHRTQVVGAARALNWPAEEIRLSFNARERYPTPLLGATLSTLDETSKALIRPPYPDLVIGMGRRVSPVMRWIKRASGDRTRVVLIGRKTPGDFADLTVRCAHFGRAPHERLLELVVPPTQVDAATLDQVRAEQPDPMAGLADPKTVLLVGGPTAQHRLEAPFAGRMAREIADATARIGGALAIVTSRRTPADVVEAIKAGAPSAQLHVWRPDEAYNPYLAYLAHAGLIVVTGESESMLAEAVATGKPITIYPLAEKPKKPRRWPTLLTRLAEGGGPLAPLCRKLLLDGWATPTRDLTIMHRLLGQRGWGKVFDGALNVDPPSPHDETTTLTQRIRNLVPAGRAGA